MGDCACAACYQLVRPVAHAACYQPVHTSLYGRLCVRCMLPACACSMRDRTYKLLVSYAHAPPTSSYLVTVHAVLVGLYGQRRVDSLMR
jgi:hypothetical protein